MSVDPRVAQRYNARLLLPGPETALRDEVVRIGGRIEALTVIAHHGASQAIVLQGLAADQTRVLEREVRGGGGDLVANAAGDRAVLLMPLDTAGALPARLAAWSDTAGELGAAIAAALAGHGVTPPSIQLNGATLAFGARTLVVGVVNTTPDSFSGDGTGDDIAAAVARGLAMVESGADVIDIGGESTRPNSSPVSEEDERARVLPVVRELARRTGVPLSIDTRKAAVARAALDAGASIVNDVWGLRGDSGMAGVVASYPRCAVVAMHNQHTPVYGDILEDICAALRESLAIAAAAGVPAERVIVDPGFGFAKTPAHNLELVRRLGELRSLGRPILVGVSRKSTIGAVTGGAPPDDRLEGSLVLASLAIAAGAHAVRVHDVAATVRAVRAADAVVRGTPDAVAILPMPGRTG